MVTQMANRCIWVFPALLPLTVIKEHLSSEAANGDVL